MSAAAFYKDLTSYIYTQTNDGYDFSDLCATTPDSAFSPGVVKECTGNFFIDDEVLKSAGKTDLSEYAVDPSVQPMPDFFV